MTTVEQFLESVGRGTVTLWRPTETNRRSTFAEDWNTADAASNALLFPERSQRPRTDSLAALRGGLVSDSTLRARVSAIVGPGATIRGIAKLVHPVFAAAATASNPAPAVEEIAKALLVYSEFYIPVPAMTGYADGLRIPLPIEIDQASGDWIVNGNSIRLWAGTLDPARVPLLDQRPKRLAQPDPVVLTKEVEQFLKDQKTPLARGLHVLARILTNPFREVFFVFEVMRQMDSDRRARFELVLCCLDNAVNHQAQLLASVTAGHAILRRLDRVLADTVLSPPAWLTEAHKTKRTRARSLLSNALQPGGVRTVRRELPETPQQLADQPGGMGKQREVRADDPPGGRHRMVLGRDVLAGEMGNVTKSGQTFRGPSYDGRIDPVGFINLNPSLLNPSLDPMLNERLFLLKSLAANLGLLDAVRMRDRILSFGILGWSADDARELPSLLAHFDTMDHDDFDLFFGLYDLAARSAGMDARGAETFALDRVEPNDTRVELATLDARRDFFGGRKAGTMTTFDTRWAARCRAAAIASWKLRATQIQEAMNRFNRIILDVGNLKVGGRPVPVNLLVTSQLGVALIFDAHMSMPGFVRDDLQKAVTASGVLDDDKLDEAITRNYRPIRHTNDTATRNKNIDALQLSVTHGSFKGW
jgi:hypothetical protein